MQAMVQHHGSASVHNSRAFLPCPTVKYVAAFAAQAFMEQHGFASVEDFRAHLCHTQRYLVMLLCVRRHSWSSTALPA